MDHARTCVPWGKELFPDGSDRSGSVRVSSGLPNVSDRLRKFPFVRVLVHVEVSFDSVTKREHANSRGTLRDLENADEIFDEQELFVEVDLPDTRRGV